MLDYVRENNPPNVAKAMLDWHESAVFAWRLEGSVNGARVNVGGLARTYLSPKTHVHGSNLVAMDAQSVADRMAQVLNSVSVTASEAAEAAAAFSAAMADASQVFSTVVITPKRYGRTSLTLLKPGEEGGP